MTAHLHHYPGTHVFTYWWHLRWSRHYNRLEQAVEAMRQQGLARTWTWRARECESADAASEWHAVMVVDARRHRPAAQLTIRRGWMQPCNMCARL